MNAAQVNAEITGLLRSRHTLLWITTIDEFRVKRACITACGDANYPTMVWDCATGLTDATGKVIENIRDPGAMLEYIRNTPRRAVYVLCDLHAWMDQIVARTLRTMSQELKSGTADDARSIIMLSPNAQKAAEVPEATVIEYPLPDRAEVTRLHDDTIKGLREDLRAGASSNGSRDAAIDGALGLAAFQIENSYSRSLVTSRKIDPGLVTNEKRRVIAGIPGLTWYDPDPRGLDAIGGCGDLKTWCLQRKAAFSPRAREYGLPTPKGLVLVGPPGTGKSLTAKCVGTALRMCVVRLDLGECKGKFVGESEANIRRALALAETVAPCVLWIDEIEKGLAGATGPQGDGGVSTDALGALLSWMQEKTAPVFVIATANDVRALPPELLRKGRFDELFFIDLPTHTERVEIVSASLKANKRSPESIDCAAVARATDGFVGAEIAALVPDAMFVAFADSEREINTADLVAAAATVVPLSKTASERINELRAWAKGRARPASTPESTATSIARALDL